MSIEKVDCLEQIELVSNLAKEIWHEHYIPIIGIDQVEYMLKKFQSVESITAQIEKQGYNYLIIKENSTDVAGYCSIRVENSDRKLFLSKIYVKKCKRGKGFAKEMVEYIQKLAKNNSLNQIYLTVNKNNIKSILAYEKMGFITNGEIIQDIGDGFLMDDFLMVKNI